MESGDTLYAIDKTPQASSVNRVDNARDHVFRKEGEYWTISYRDHTFRLKNRKGLGYINRLLANPAQEFHALDLATEPPAALREAIASGGTERAAALGLSTDHLGDAGEVLDAEARTAYKQRLTELRYELDDANETGNAERSAQVRGEMDTLARELAHAVGLHGRGRRAASVSERARYSVTHAIKAALEKIAEHDAALGRLLSTTVKTGTFCAYYPDPRFPVIWQL